METLWTIKKVTCRVSSCWISLASRYFLLAWWTIIVETSAECGNNKVFMVQQRSERKIVSYNVTRMKYWTSWSALKYWKAILKYSTLKQPNSVKCYLSNLPVVLYKMSIDRRTVSLNIKPKSSANGAVKMHEKMKNFILQINTT